MRSPIRDLAGNLMWTNNGTCWATFQLTPRPYGHRPVKDKKVICDLHRLMVRALPGEWMMMGLSVSMDPTAVVERMIDGYDDATLPPMWREECLATLEEFSEDDAPVLGQRLYYLAVPLSNPGSSKFKAPMEAAMGSLKEMGSLPRNHPRTNEIEFRMTQSASIQQALPSPFKPRPATIVDQIWVARHAQMRGMQHIPPEAAQEFDPMVTTTGVALPEPNLDPGAVSDLEDSGKRWFQPKLVNPFKRRVLKVTDVDNPDAQPSYQSLLVMAATPPSGVSFPGSELFARLDEYGPEVDWVIRGKNNSRDEAMQKNRRAVNAINDQYDQRNGADNQSFGTHDLDLAAELLSEYQAKFASDRTEVEVEHTVILSASGDTFEAADEAGEQLARILGGADFKFDRPVGALKDLWWAMQPGVATGSTIRSYSQFTHSDSFAKLVPFTSTKLGGSKGPVLALNTSTARQDVVHLNPLGYPEIDRSGSVACVGELGAGKTFFMKTLVGHIVALGGQMLCIDKDQTGEWARFAEILLPGQSLIVDCVNDEESGRSIDYSMDPLRLFTNLGEASSAAQSFFTTLLGLKSTKEPGTTLHSVLRPVYLREHYIESSAQLLTHLESSETGLEHAATLARLMRVAADTIHGDLIFNEDLPVVDLTMRAVVWRTDKTRLPGERHMEKEFMFDQLDAEQIFGWAYYRLLTKVARAVAFADASVPSCLVCDEAYDIFSNPDNREDVAEFPRKGRRSKALLIIGSHNPDKDFGDDTMRRLIPTRLVFRHTDAGLARASVRFLDIDEDDPEFERMVDTVMHDTSPTEGDLGTAAHRRGECFIRDVFGGVGEARVLGPAQQHLASAVRSTPPKAVVNA